MVEEVKGLSIENQNGTTRRIHTQPAPSTWFPESDLIHGTDILFMVALQNHIKELVGKTIDIKFTKALQTKKQFEVKIAEPERGDQTLAAIITITNETEQQTTICLHTTEHDNGLPKKDSNSHVNTLVADQSITKDKSTNSNTLKLNPLQTVLHSTTALHTLLDTVITGCQMLALNETINKRKPTGGGFKNIKLLEKLDFTQPYTLKLEPQEKTEKSAVTITPVNFTLLDQQDNKIATGTMEWVNRN